MDVSDVEFLWDLRPGHWRLLLGAGVRYAYIRRLPLTGSFTVFLPRVVR